MQAQTRARNILEHAITASSSPVATAARRLAQQPMSLGGFGEVDQLRQHMLDKGLALDEPLFTVPLMPAQPAVGLGNSAVAKSSSIVDKIKPFAMLVGYVGLVYVAYRVTKYAYYNTVGKPQPKRRSLPRSGHMRILGQRTR